MYFITNRALDNSKRAYNKFLKTPNKKGPNELSAVSVEGPSANPKVEILGDRLSKKQVQAFKKEFNLDIDENQAHYASLYVACEVFRQARKECKNVLYFIHGYNNDVKDIYETARSLEKLFGVIVVVFTWPSNGGGALSGTLSYLSDKRDARSSQDALNRAVDLVGKYHGLLTNATRSALQAKVAGMERLERNPTKQREMLSKLLEQHCDLSVSLLCHSMGNYVLKHALNSSLAETRKLIFDNIILAAPDTNNEDHKEWLDVLQVRKSIYVLINENDYALSWSRRKPGEEQKPRLGHYLKKLNGDNCFYIDFTKEKGVNKSHSYFDSKTVNANNGIKRFFTKVFSGESAISNLDYIAHNNTYRPK